MKKLKAHQQERAPATPPIEGVGSARTVLADKGSLRRAKRRALVSSAPFRPIHLCDGRLRREHLHGLAAHYQFAGLDAHNFKRPPDQLEPEHIRQYQAYLFRDRKLAANTVNQRTGALRFFFITVLKKPWSVAEAHTHPRFTIRACENGTQRQRAPNHSRGRIIETP